MFVGILHRYSVKYCARVWVWVGVGVWEYVEESVWEGFGFLQFTTWVPTVTNTSPSKHLTLNVHRETRGTTTTGHHWNLLATWRDRVDSASSRKAGSASWELCGL